MFIFYDDKYDSETHESKTSHETHESTPWKHKKTEAYWHFQGAKKDCTLPVAWQLALTEIPCHCQASNCISVYLYYWFSNTLNKAFKLSGSPSLLPVFHVEIKELFKVSLPCPNVVLWNLWKIVRYFCYFGWLYSIQREKGHCSIGHWICYWIFLRNSPFLIFVDHFIARVTWF